MIANLLHRIQRKLLKTRLHPIRVFVVHNVCDTYSTIVGPRADWVSTDDFHHSIEQLQKRYTFISIEDALHHIRHDVVRMQDYAVLTADDGYRSVFLQLPWLIEHNVPVSLYINPKYLDGVSYSEHLWSFVHNANPNLTESEFVTGRYMTSAELQSITSSLVSIGLHGYEHINNARLSANAFREYIEKTIAAIKPYSDVIPFHAYPWGYSSEETDKVLHELNICPLRADGLYNINDDSQIHREYLPIY